MAVVPEIDAASGRTLRRAFDSPDLNPFFHGALMAPNRPLS
jgi:hypothetical protein